jgi:hypothetical protein
MVDQSVFLRPARRKLNVAVAFLPRGQALPLAEADRLGTPGKSRLRSGQTLSNMA